MPIPAFDSISGVLPPHLGNPTTIRDLSPYLCTITELCARFSTSAKRREILMGLLNFRARLFDAGVQGFQWLGGSFVEDIETIENRSPNDIDVVTFVGIPSTLQDFAQLLRSAPDLGDRKLVKATHLLDHFYLPLSSKPVTLVHVTRFWYGLFSHRRDKQWKGMLAVPMVDKSEDDAARPLLGASP